MSAWKKTRLGECCEIVSGSTPSTSCQEFWGDEVCWATPKDLAELDGAYIGDTPRKLTRLGLESCAATILPTGSVLFSSRAPIGHTAINAVPMATNQGFKSLVPDGRQLDAKFLYRWLRFKRPYIESLGNGATFKEVSKAVVARVEIELPPLLDQRRIAAILDKADDLRAKRRAALAALDGLAQSVFVEMFGDPFVNPRGWRRVPLASVVRRGDTINYGVVQPGTECPSGVPLVRVGDLVEGVVAHGSLKRIDPTIEASYKRSRLRGDEVLVSCVGSTGVVALADESLKGFNIARAVARVPLSEAVNRLFIAEYLRTAEVQTYFSRELRTVSQPTLNIKQLSETPTICPPLKLQDEFARRVMSMQVVRRAVVASAQELQRLFESTQHRAFRGKL